MNIINMTKRKTKAELEAENEELKKQVEACHQAYDNIVIIQESIVKAIKQITLEKKKAKKEEDTDKMLIYDGYLKCLYKMSSWINMHSDKKVDKNI